MKVNGGKYRARKGSEQRKEINDKKTSGKVTFMNEQPHKKDSKIFIKKCGTIIPPKFLPPILKIDNYLTGLYQISLQIHVFVREIKLARDSSFIVYLQFQQRGKRTNE